MEELAKARWLYEAAEYQWSRPLGLYGLEPQPAGDIVVPEQLRNRRLPHLTKLQTAEQYASGLGGFWDAARRIEYYQLPDLAAFESAARQRNLDKQAGFYVDRDDDVILSPLEAGAEGVPDLVVLAAQTIEMQLIEDHTRQQDAPDGAPVDSSQDLHWTILPLAHPNEFACFVERTSRLARPSPARRTTRSLGNPTASWAPNRLSWTSRDGPRSSALFCRDPVATGSGCLGRRRRTTEDRQRCRPPVNQVMGGCRPDP